MYNAANGADKTLHDYSISRVSEVPGRKTKEGRVLEALEAVSWLDVRVPVHKLLNAAAVSSLVVTSLTRSTPPHPHSQQHCIKRGRSEGRGRPVTATIAAAAATHNSRRRRQEEYSILPFLKPRKTNINNPFKIISKTKVNSRGQ